MYMCMNTTNNHSRWTYLGTSPNKHPHPIRCQLGAKCLPRSTTHKSFIHSLRCASTMSISVHTQEVGRAWLVNHSWKSLWGCVHEWYCTHPVYMRVHTRYIISLFVPGLSCVGHLREGSLVPVPNRDKD